MEWAFIQLSKFAVKGLSLSFNCLYYTTTYLYLSIDILYKCVVVYLCNIYKCVVVILEQKNRTYLFFTFYLFLCSFPEKAIFWDIFFSTIIFYYFCFLVRNNQLYSFAVSILPLLISSFLCVRYWWNLYHPLFIK